MSGHIYYLVGKPSSLKYQFLDQLIESSKNTPFIKFPRVFTTQLELDGIANMHCVDARDFEMRNTMGIYCLDWVKNSERFGVCGEGAQWAQNGYTVIINGSLLNAKDALKAFPEMQIVFIRQAMHRDLNAGTTLVESDHARIDWVDNLNGVHCPYILSIYQLDELESASNIFLQFIETNENFLLEKVC